MKNFENGIHAFISNAGNVGPALYEGRVCSGDFQAAFERANHLADEFIDSEFPNVPEKVFVGFEEWDEVKEKPVCIVKFYVFEKYF